MHYRAHWRSKVGVDWSFLLASASLVFTLSIYAQGKTVAAERKLYLTST